MTSQQVFELTMALIDSVNESTGDANITDNNEYKVRTLPIINILRVRLYPYSDTYKNTDDGERPVLPLLTSLNDELGIDDGLAAGVLPYGLAYELLKDENTDVAGLMLQLFQELLEQYARGVPATFTTIDDVYGGIEHGEYSRWG